MLLFYCFLVVVNWDSQLFIQRHWRTSIWIHSSSWFLQKRDCVMSWILLTRYQISLFVVFWLFLYFGFVVFFQLYKLTCLFDKNPRISLMTPSIRTAPTYDSAVFYKLLLGLGHLTSASSNFFSDTSLHCLVLAIILVILHLQKSFMSKLSNAMLRYSSIRHPHVSYERTSELVSKSFFRWNMAFLQRTVILSRVIVRSTVL